MSSWPTAAPRSTPPPSCSTLRPIRENAGEWPWLSGGPRAGPGPVTGGGAGRTCCGRPRPWPRRSAGLLRMSCRVTRSAWWWTRPGPWLVGVPKTFRISGRDLTLTLTDLVVEGSDVARAMGQYGQVRFYARDVQWDGYQLDRLEILARNVHLRPGRQPALVAAPLLVEVFVPASVASRWLAAALPRFEVTWRDGLPQLSLPARRGPGWKWRQVPMGAPSSSGPGPCSCAAGACPCDPRPSAWPGAACPATSCLPRPSPRRAVSWSVAGWGSGSGRCPVPTSSGCWPRCAGERTASTCDHRSLP
jgi:hypothetical protein